MSLIRSARGFSPKIAEDAFIAEDASIIGDVEIKGKASVWYHVTLRGDVMPIKIGRESNIQDNTVIHGTYQEFGCSVGDRVTIGHSVILHGCKIGDLSLIGMGSILMDGVEIGAQSIVGAGSLITEGKKFPPKSLILGRPAKLVRPLTESEVKSLDESADHYLMYKEWYK